ncbi:hypothetical protein C8J56DRAFT_1169352 [Mycena floridula]|nr:hypothetical protein C8J56DRAFT_1169352 [Mycena floridula]
MAFQHKLQDLEKPFGRMRTGEEKEAAFFSFIQEWPPQQEHWQLHKKDCKGSSQADGWKPSWMVDHREPMFISNDLDHISFGMGMILFRNIAAYDVLNLSRNEGFDNVRSKDLSLATVNELPNDYSGSLSVVFNDHNPIVVSDTAEQALHLWYSLFLPSGYPVFVLAAIQGHIEQAMKGSIIGLTSTTTLKPIIT